MAVTSIPLEGTPTSIFDSRNPTLVPNFDRSTANTFTVDHSSPAIFAANSARVAATVALTIGGTPTTGNVITLTFTFGTTGAVFTVVYTVTASDTTNALIASSLAGAINNSQAARSAGVYATSSGAVITISCDGPTGNFVTVTFADVPANSTGAFTNSGVLSGGSGPIVPTNNFNWSMGGTVTSFFYGVPTSVGYDVLLAMVNQGMPIT